MGCLIAKNLKLFMLRKERGWDQITAANAIGVHVNAYAKIEQGKSRGKVDVWNKIQQVYNIPDEEMWQIIKGSF